jgi:predicted lactoylglutathione lyase
MQFPTISPEIPVGNLAPAVTYYRDQLGFNVDWAEEHTGFGCVSRGDTRLFITTPSFRSYDAFVGPIALWLNLGSRAEIDTLHAEWAAAGAKIILPPEAKPYKLYEFYAEDLDGNVFRVFYDFGWEER